MWWHNRTNLINTPLSRQDVLWTVDQLAKAAEKRVAKAATQEMYFPLQF